MMEALGLREEISERGCMFSTPSEPSCTSARPASAVSSPESSMRLVTASSPSMRRIPTVSAPEWEGDTYIWLQVSLLPAGTVRVPLLTRTLERTVTSPEMTASAWVPLYLPLTVMEVDWGSVTPSPHSVPPSWIPPLPFTMAPEARVRVLPGST